MTEAKVSVSEVQEGMKTSKDVISQEGIFLMPKDTVISKNHILKLQLYQMSHITIYETPLEPIFVTLKESKTEDVIVSQTKEFKDFSTKYLSGVNAIEREFSNMVQKGSVDSKSLSSIVDTFIHETSNNQLFSYLCRIQSKDDATFSHSMNVSILATILGKWLHLDDHSIMNLSIAGLLHDIGKTQIDPKILNKKGKLTPDEFEYIKTHTTLGYKIIADAPLDDGIKQAVLMHHEKMNGSGYPLHLSWEKIHMYAKIIAIVDIYDAITSDRPYHNRFHPFTAIRVLEEECYGVLETDYLYVFLENIAHNFLGNDVLLSTGEEAKIIFINPQSPSHPMVQTKSSKFIDLLSYDFITIDKFI
ncbi:MAG: hypothetical protein CVU84_15620 [Firmicutes bacterium HGW-Firmicutes-1]|jgi:putative nucleotidyltransferase with HDIG domain|nr:MAG: hypothetical protein CVU84_15620 [Firmicutes bacterium HGW-Firmicutes-1]